MPYKDKNKRNQRQKERYHKDVEKSREKARIYYQKNKEKIRKQKNKQYNAQTTKLRKERLYNENQKLLIENNLLTNCIICNFPKEKFSAIDFHHINPATKDYDMTYLIHRANKEKLINEAKKCVCLCRNCHALYHNGDIEIQNIFNKVIATRG